MNTTERGLQAQCVAERHLVAAGLVIVARNYRCPRGEIDLIAKDGSCWVFVEVRMRASTRWGTALETINRCKQVRWQRAAHYYLQQRRLFERVPSRFDAVAVDGEGRVTWLADVLWGAEES